MGNTAMDDEQRKKLIAGAVVLGMGVGTGLEGLASTHELVENLANEGSQSNALKIVARGLTRNDFLPHGPESSPSHVRTVQRIVAVASANGSHIALPFERDGWTIFYAKLPRYLDPPK